MDDKAIRKFQKELNSGAVSLVIMTVMEQLDRPVYGYEIAKLLQSRAGGDLPMNQAAIYPVLRSLEKQQLLCSETLPSDAGPPRKYYRLTPTGHQALKAWKSVWQDTTSFVDSILEHSDGATGQPEDPRSTDHAVPSRVGTGRQAKGRRRS